MQRIPASQADQSSGRLRANLHEWQSSFVLGGKPDSGPEGNAEQEFTRPLNERLN